MVYYGLKGSVVLLIVVSGLANLKGKSSGKIGLLTMVYYMTTTLIAIILGIVLALVIKPGEVTVGGTSSMVGRNQPLPTAVDTVFDLLRYAAFSLSHATLGCNCRRNDLCSLVSTIDKKPKPKSSNNTFNSLTKRLFSKMLLPKIECVRNFFSLINMISSMIYWILVFLISYGNNLI